MTYTRDDRRSILTIEDMKAISKRIGTINTIQPPECLPITLRLTEIECKRDSAGWIVTEFWKSTGDQ